MKQVIATDRAPKAIGPYSQATVAGGFVFCSGQGPLDPATGQLVAGGIALQTERALENLKGVIEAGGSALDKVVKVTVFLKDLKDFRTMNEVYLRYFPASPPARTTVEAARLPLDILVEIDAIASLE